LAAAVRAEAGLADSGAAEVLAAAVLAAVGNRDRQMKWLRTQKVRRLKSNSNRSRDFNFVPTFVGWKRVEEVRQFKRRSVWEKQPLSF
jgi:hypothetical protein